MVHTPDEALRVCQGAGRLLEPLNVGERILVVVSSSEKRNLYFG